MAEPEPQAEPDEAEAPPKKGRSKAVMLLLLLVLAGAGGGGYFLYGQELLGDGEAVARTPIYIPMDPPFVVNLENSELLKFLQVELQVMAFDPKVQALIEQHAPVIRNNLLLILAAEKTADLGSREGKASLQRRITEEINAVLAARAGGARVEETYFTSFVMQ